MHDAIWRNMIFYDIFTFMTFDNDYLLFKEKKSEITRQNCMDYLFLQHKVTL